MLSALQSKLLAVNQSHLLAFWQELNADEQQEFTTQLNGIDFEEANRLFKLANTTLLANETLSALDARMRPIPSKQTGSESRCSIDTLHQYERMGLQQIGAGRVAVVLLAGGQGTRLGVTYPKGMYRLGLPSGKTLFQLQAERIRKVQELGADSMPANSNVHSIVPWYIMTSGPTHQGTVKFLKAHNYFGLQPSNVIVFEQGVLPCFDFNGRILLESKNRVSVAPDGNGGIYVALKRNGILDDMERRGVRYVHVHSVDNILVRVADPVFIGYCANMNVDCAAKVVRKTCPTEAVGVVCEVDGRVQVVEYSEIGEQTASRRNEDGELVFSAGNICNHLFSVDFLHKMSRKELRLHVAKKRIPYVDRSTGESVKPSEVNGIKIEKFVFDVFEFSEHFGMWEVPRAFEFSAMKNCNETGKDCPDTAVKDLLALHKVYVERAGGVVRAPVEISPLLSYAGEGLEFAVQGRVFDMETHLTDDRETVLYTNGNGCTTNGRV